jgi:hypothetical protein
MKNWWEATGGRNMTKTMSALLRTALMGIVIATSANYSIAAFFVSGLDNDSGVYPIVGNQAWGGQLGDDFLTGSNPLKITEVAIFDDDGDGTTKPLVWQLFNVTSGLLVHQETIGISGATGGTTVESNYVFKTIAPLILAPNTLYSAVAYGFDNANKNFNTNFNLADFGVSFSNAGLTGGNGRWSDPDDPFYNPSTLPNIVSPTGSSNPPQDYNFGAASFVYAAVPEASSFLVVGLGGIFAFGVIGLGKRYGISVKV